MATSIQTIAQYAEAFNDMDLIAVICLSNDELASSPGEYSELGASVIEWKKALGHYGPGTIDLHLDTLVQSEHGASELERLLTVLVDQLSNQGTIPADRLNRHSVSGVHFKDYPASLVIEAVVRLRGLLGVALPKT